MGHRKSRDDTLKYSDDLLPVARHGSVRISREESERSKVKFRSKRQLIVRYHRNSPEMTAKQIASMLKTTEGYVYNVWNKSEVERPRRDRIFGVGGHGRVWYENAVLVRQFKRLRAVVVNSRTGMKQIGFKDRGDPCSCQVHSNGKVIIFPHGLAWRPWLISEFQKAGWDSDLASLVVETTYLVVKELHGAARVPKDFLPHDFYAKTDWGVVVVRDTSPYPNTFEMKLIVPDMQKYLGLPEIQQKLKAVEQGSVTMNQALRAILTVLARQNREIYDLKGALADRLEKAIEKFDKKRPKEGEVSDG